MTATTPRTVPPFRADHVGSLLRPQAVHDARAAHARGELDADALRAVEDASIAELVAKQEEIGLQVATDGEQRRGYWHLDFIRALPGVRDSETEAFEVPFISPDGTPIIWREPRHEVVGPIALTETIFGRDLAFVQEHVTTAVPKLSIPSPNHVSSLTSPAVIATDAYADRAELNAAIAAAYADEIARLAAQGLTYLQIDDVSLSLFGDPNVQGQIRAAGGDPSTAHLGFIQQFNAALAGRPEGLTVTTHLCRGNFQSSWAAQGGYDVVAEALFNDLDVDGYFLEYDDERSGSFEPLRFLPPGKTVVLGLVTSKHPALESKDDLKRRIDEAATYAPIEQLALSPQCGFSSTAEGNSLTPQEQWAKLRLVVEVAEEVWG